MTINSFLTKRLSISKEAAIDLIKEKRVLINGTAALQKQIVSEVDMIISEGKEIQIPVSFTYIAYYKPKGIECTLNPGIEQNLLSALPFAEHLFPVGRLDKESEGLLLLTDDGKLYKQIAMSDAFKEKEYLVRVNKILTINALGSLAAGIKIMGKQTRPATVESLDDYAFSIVLTQGLNRQIRRMCYKLGYEVTMLKRVRIMSLKLGDLQPNEYKVIRKVDIL